MPALRIDNPILYGIAPYYTTDEPRARFREITRRIPRLAELGINCLWLQPVFENHGGGQGYDTTDYFRIWSDLGTEDELGELIGSAHRNGIAVLFDFVPNHTSRHHPFVLDILENGRRSPYYEFYMHQKDGAPYGNYYSETEIRGVRFIHYFWDDLFNIDLDSAAARAHLIEAAEYWVREFDIDGYRFDTAWGPRARCPDFFIELRDRLRALKPGILLVGEDKASEPEAVEHRGPSPSEIFDVVYDWAPPAGHVYKWSWQRESKAQTIFNCIEEVDLVGELRASITGTLRTRPGQGQVLRFIENNDTPRFVTNHTLEQTKLAATLAFTLPGVPLVYYGQEVGTHYDYPSFARIDFDGDWEGGRALLAHYRELIRLRRTRPELSAGTFEEVPATPESPGAKVFAYRRRLAARESLVVLNLGAQPAAARLADAGSQPVRLQPFEARII